MIPASDSAAAGQRGGLKLGLNTPLLTALPGGFGPWERAAGVDDLVSVVVEAERLGFDHVSCSEHVAVPTAVADQRGGTYWDPLSTLSFLAAKTRRIRLVPLVLVLGYHHPLAIAKRYGTLDVLSGGRTVLGVGVGSLREEFELLGAEFAGRGERADDALRALRRAWGTTTPSYAGRHFSFSDVVVDPCAVTRDPTIWVGGRTMRSLRRAVELGDGWVPFGLDADELAGLLGAVDLPEGFDVVLSPGGPLDPLGDAGRTTEELGRLHEVGATMASVRLTARSLAHYLEQQAAVVSLVAGI